MSPGSGGDQGLRLVASIDGAPSSAPVRPLRRFSAEPLVGRRSELAKAIRMVTHSTRLLTVIGPGGVGKSSFAREMATQLHQEFAHDVVDVPLESVSEPGLAVVAIARALRLSSTDDRDPIDALAACIGERRMLLVLDNLEQVIDVAPRIGELLGICPSLHVIVTSRLALRIVGEIEFALEPLEVPPHGVEASVDITEVESVVMLSRAVRRFDHDFTIDASNASAVAEICRSVEGLPLAIELAAARLRLLSPATLADLLSRRLDLLRNDRRDALPHHHTLRSTIEWSYRLLKADQQAVLRALGVFAGGFTVDAVAAVMDADTHQVLDHLDHLVRHHLVRVDIGPEVTQPFMLFDSIRQFSSEELVVLGEDARRRAAHAAWVRTTTEKWAAALIGPEQAAALAALDVEIDNIRAALGWAFSETGDRCEGLRIATALWRYWWLRGRLKEGRAWLGQGLAEQPGASNSHLADAYKAAAVMADEDSDVAAAESLLEKAMAIYSELGDAVGLADCWYNLGLIAKDRGDLDGAEALLHDSIKVFDGPEHTRKRAMALGTLAMVDHLRGDLSTAAGRLREVVRLIRALDDRGSLAKVVGNLGLVQLAQGDIAGAVRSQEEALEIGREVDDAVSTSMAITNLAAALLASSDVERAESLLLEAAELYREMGDPRGSAVVTYSLGRCAERRGDHRRAGELWLTALAKFVTDQANPDIGSCLESIAGWATVAGAFDDANALFAAATTLRERDGSVPDIDVATIDRNRRLARAGVTDEAADALAEHAATWSLDDVEVMAIECVERLGSLSTPPATDDRARLAEQTGLTLRELDVMELLVERHTDREIAELLYISTRTVTTHVSAILRKLGVTSRREVAAAIAQRAGRAAH